MARTTVNRDRAALLRDVAVGIGVAAVVFSLSYANGGFDATTRAYAGIAGWWLLGVGAAIGTASARSGISRLALTPLGLLAAFGIWTLISINWASDGGRVFAQFDQVSLYVAVLAIAIVLARLVPASVLVGGVALALAAISIVALVSRCFPSTFGLQPGTTILSPLVNRLSFPLGYWNGLGIEVALAYPLLLAIMTSRRSRVASGLAALPLPVLAADMYLTSSRGAFAAAAVAVAAYLLLTPRRWAALAGLAVAGAAGAVAVATLVPRKALVNGEVSTALGVSQGHHAALVIGIACVLAALVWVGLAEVGRRVPTPSQTVGRVTAAVLVLLVIGAIVAAHPIAKFDAFKSNSVAASHGTDTESHLLSSSGSGRWQFWGAAISEFRDHPLNGGGAGSWQAWWLQHGSLPVQSEYSHSLYLDALGELGIIGFLLITGAVLVALAGAVRSALALKSAEIAAAAACGIAFFAASTYDWIWQLAGITVVGVGMVGFALGALPSTRTRVWARAGAVRPALALVAVAAIIPQVVVLAAGIHLRNSQSAFRNGDLTRARSEALAAEAVEPWAASSYLQLALVSERDGSLAAAGNWLDKAIARSPRDWGLWLTAARIDTERLKVASARRDLAETRRLFPNYKQFLGTG